MLNFKSFFLGLLTTVVAASSTLIATSSYAHVVINNISVGNTALSTSATGVASKAERATGTVVERQARDAQSDSSYLVSSDMGPKKGSKPQKRERQRYLSNSKSTSSQASSGGGGGGSRRGRASRRRRQPSDHVPVVTVNNSQPLPSSGSDSDGVKLPLYDDGASPAGSPSGSSGGSSGGGLPSKPGPSDEPSPDIGTGSQAPAGGGTISGTPEPAALAVWAIAGCCGYGFVRFRQQRVSRS